MKTRTFLIVAVTLMTIFVASNAMAQGFSPKKPPFFAVLLGGNEVSPTGQANAGDRNGVGSATILINEDDGTTLCFGLIVNGIDQPINAHIHRGRAGENGPVVVPFTDNLPTTGNPGASSGCIPDLNPNILEDIQSDPGGFYFNVHTGPFPSGAIRGQLF